MEVDLVAGPSVCALNVGRELMAQLFLGEQGTWGQVHEPRPGHTGQGHREIVGHDDFIAFCGEDGGGVDL
jgi:hypothetical protein